MPIFIWRSSHSLIDQAIFYKHRKRNGTFTLIGVVWESVLARDDLTAQCWRFSEYRLLSSQIHWWASCQQAHCNPFDHGGFLCGSTVPFSRKHKNPHNLVCFQSCRAQWLKGVKKVVWHPTALFAVLTPNLFPLVNGFKIRCKLPEWPEAPMKIIIHVEFQVLETVAKLGAAKRVTK